MNELNQMTWKLLPDSLLLKIFNLLEESDLVHASSTCTRWRRLFYEPRFWRSITFDFNHSFQSPEDIEKKLRNHLLAIGFCVRNVTIVCPVAGFFVHRQITDWIRVILDTLVESNRTIQSFQLNQLKMVCRWKYSVYTKCDLIVSLCNFIESQTCLQSLNLSEPLLPTTFGHMVMSSLAKSPSVDTLQRLDIFYLYASDRIGVNKKNANLIRSVLTKLRKLREIKLNYRLLKDIEVEQVCTILQHSLEKLELTGSRANVESYRFEERYIDNFSDDDDDDDGDDDDYSEDNNYDHNYDARKITRDSWTQAIRACPDLRVSIDVHFRYDKLDYFLLPTIPVSNLTIRGINSDFENARNEECLIDVLSGRFYKNLETVNLVGEADDYDLELMLATDPAHFAARLMSFPRLRSVQISSGLISYTLLEMVKSALRERYGVDRDILRII